MPINALPAYMEHERPAEGEGGASVGVYPTRTDLCDTQIVKGGEFLRKLHRLARTAAFAFSTIPVSAKSSHGRVWLEAESTILKDPKKELGTGLLRACAVTWGSNPATSKRRV
jgi:hypothetical protein